MEFSKGKPLSISIVDANAYIRAYFKTVAAGDTFFRMNNL
jgi:hypothetical protein